eukprot:3337719-Pyramimonas_sp.AAC.1
MPTGTAAAKPQSLQAWQAACDRARLLERSPEPARVEQHLGALEAPELPLERRPAPDAARGR